MQITFRTREQNAVVALLATSDKKRNERLRGALFNGARKVIIADGKIIARKTLDGKNFDTEC